MLVAAALLGCLVGVALGFLGGGGSMLALPILVHVLGLDERRAIAGSLVVVGVTAAVAGARHAVAGNVAWRRALPFAAASMATAWAAGRLSHLVPTGWLVVL